MAKRWKPTFSFSRFFELYYNVCTRRPMNTTPGDPPDIQAAATHPGQGFPSHISDVHNSLFSVSDEHAGKTVSDVQG